MEFLVGALMVVLLVRWAMLRSRLAEIENRLQQESDRRTDSEAKVAKLTLRISELELRTQRPLESRPAEPKMAEPKPVEPKPPELKPEPAVKPAAMPPPIERPAVRICQFCGREVTHGAAICFCGAVIDYAVAIQQETKAAATAPPPLPTTAPEVSVPATPTAMPSFAPVVASEPRESLRDRLRKRAGDQEWEAIVGGNWLNKVGVLVLVIGITLLLGYEFGRVGPWGRVAIGLGVSLVMLMGGVLIERKALYRIFARGLIGGGWAALYFTTYAMHAVATARVIDDPFLATALLLAVSAGTISHSLRYRSQTVSGLAYFIAFGTLALADNTTFA